MFWLPEGIAAAYLSILVALLIFGLGTPVLLLQLSASERQRSLVRKYSWHLSGGFPLIVAVMVLSCVLMAVYLAFFPISATYSADFLWAEPLLLTNIALTIAFWIGNFGVSLAGRLAGCLSQRLRFHYRNTGYLPAAELRDLIELGASDGPDREQPVVLDEVRHVLRAVMLSQTYDGRRLDCFLRYFSTGLAKSWASSDSDSLSMGADVLLECHHILTSRELSGEPDFRFLRIALRRLARIAVVKDSDEVTRRVLEASPEDTRMLYEIGVAALCARKYGVSHVCLNRLAKHMRKRDDLVVENDTTVHFLGVLAHSSQSEDPSMAELANGIAIDVLGTDANAISSAVDYAKEYYMSRYLFGTVRRLDILGEWLVNH